MELLMADGGVLLALLMLPSVFLMVVVGVKLQPAVYAGKAAYMAEGRK